MLQPLGDVLERRAYQELVAVGGLLDSAIVVHARAAAELHQLLSTLHSQTYYALGEVRVLIEQLRDERTPTRWGRPPGHDRSNVATGGPPWWQARVRTPTLYRLDEQDPLAHALGQLGVLHGRVCPTPTGLTFDPDLPTETVLHARYPREGSRRGVPDDLACRRALHRRRRHRDPSIGD